MDKVCPQCKATKPLAAFYSNRSRSDGTSVYCRACILTWYTEKESARRHEARTLQERPLRPVRGTLAQAGRKRCASCGEEKDVALFSRSRRRRDGLDETCKACKHARWIANRETYMAHHKEWEVRTGSVQNVKNWRKRIREEMLEAYGRKCSCCGETESDFLTLDHIGGKNDTNHPWAPTRGGTSIYGKLKKMGWPKDHYRLLCWNCNCASRWTGVCPHMKEKMIEWMADDMFAFWMGQPSVYGRMKWSRNG